MQTSKLIISSFLLFVYSFGFAHYLIPHCEKESSAIHVYYEQEVIGHQHHDINSYNEHSDEHEHLQHEGHVDDGILDFLICFLSEVEHQENASSLEVYLSVKTDTKAPRLFESKLQLLAVLSVLNNLDLHSYSKTNYEEILGVYISPLIHQSPNKGPPYFS